MVCRSTRTRFTIISVSAIRIQGISKHFGAVAAVNDVGLNIPSGELFFLLGPSGCGKSTLLRMIAGLIEPSAGHIYFGDQDVTRVPTERRNAVMCFQSYALWPHMTVRDNVRFGLAVRGQPTQTQISRVDEVLRLVRLDGMADRMPSELSGGQQQRVALARALAVHPECLLLDEPLSNLDAGLRLEMRSEIRHICKTSGITTIYVTHDQKEAMSVGDRIGLMRAGAIVQVGSPRELYLQPKDRFVAEFMGSTNILPGHVVHRAAGKIEVQTEAGTIHVACEQFTPVKVMLSIRPERIRVRAGSAGSGPNLFTGEIIESSFLGESSEHVLKVNETKVRVLSSPPIWQHEGMLNFEVDPREVVVLPE